MQRQRGIGRMFNYLEFFEQVGARVKIREGKYAGWFGRILKFSNYRIGVQLEDENKIPLKGKDKVAWVPYGGILRRAWWFEKRA